MGNDEEALVRCPPAWDVTIPSTQEGHKVATLLQDGQVEVDGVAFSNASDAANAIVGKRTNGWWFFLTDQASRQSLQRARRDYVNAMAIDMEDDEADGDAGRG